MDRQETQTVLAALKSSFQQHLDREHPAPRSEDTRMVDGHISSILRNPLFSHKPKRRISHPNHFDGHVESFSQLRYLMKRPMDHFKDEIAAGTATIESAKMCLITELQKALALPDEARRDALKSSEAVSIVLHWVWSLPEHGAGSFLLDSALFKRLAPFLNAGHEHLIWQWIKQLQMELGGELHGIKRRGVRYMQGAILLYFLESEVRYGLDLDSAINMFLRGVRGISSWSGVTEKDRHAVLERAGRYLTIHIMENSKSDPGISTRVNSLIDTADIWSSTAGVHRALLGLYCPKSANIDAAFDALKQLNIRWISRQGSKNRRDILRLSLMTAELFLSTGSEAKAIWVMAFLQEYFPTEIGYSDPHVSVEEEERQRQVEEESNLRLLETLAAS